MFHVPEKKKKKLIKKGGGSDNVYIKDVSSSSYFVLFRNLSLQQKSIRLTQKKKKKKSIKIPITVFPNYCYSSSVKRKPLIN